MVQNFSSDLFKMTHDAEVDMGNVEEALNTLKSSFSGPTAPSAEQGQLWFDTTRSLLRHRGATSNWRGVIAFKDDSDYLNITKIWVYANSVGPGAEEGFTEDTDCADCVIGLKGGSFAYSVTGGDGVKRGQWAISGITIPDHSPHEHELEDAGVVTAQGAGSAAIIKDTFYTVGVLRTYVSGGSSAQIAGYTTDGPLSTMAHDTGTNNGQWRPQAAVGIMIFPAII